MYVYTTGYGFEMQVTKGSERFLILSQHRDHDRSLSYVVGDTDICPLIQQVHYNLHSVVVGCGSEWRRVGLIGMVDVSSSLHEISNYVIMTT